MLTVRFTAPEEFIEELRHDQRGPGVERSLVRVTTEYRTTAHFPVRNVVVVATYKVAGHYTLVRLDHFVGQVLGYVNPDGTQGWSDSDRKVLAHAQQVQNAIIAETAALGLEARAGTLLEEARRDRVAPAANELARE